MDLDLVNSLFGFISSFIIFYASFKVQGNIRNNYKFKKDFFQENAVKIHFSKGLENVNKSIDFSKINENKYKDVITYFCVVLINHFEPGVLNCFYNNINSLKVNDSVENIFDVVNMISLSGAYFNEENSISLYKNNKRATLFHELFHMASSRLEGQNFFSGFSYSHHTDALKDFGDGLNEGYTELLTKRYFGNVEHIELDYDYQVLIASLLEDIVTRDVMERLYLTADFQGLVGVLKKYSYEDEILLFVNNMDFVLEHGFDEGLTLNNKRILNSVIKDITVFLFKAYNKKVCLMDVDDREKDKLLRRYITKIIGHQRLLLGYDEIMDIINKENGVIR